jgi:hypothetical protein
MEPPAPLPPDAGGTAGGGSGGYALLLLAADADVDDAAAPPGADTLTGTGPRPGAAPAMSTGERDAATGPE